MSYLMIIIMYSIVLLLVSSIETSIAGAAGRSDHHRCVSTVCGNLTITPPFGIGKDCVKDESFEVTCNFSSSSTTPKLMLTQFNLELLEFGDMSVTVRSLSPPPRVCVNDMSTKKHTSSLNDSSEVRWNSVDLSGSPFFFDHDQNSLVSFGCDGFASLYNDSGRIVLGCSSTCSPSTGRVIDGCNGYHCCQISLIDFYQRYNYRYIESYSIGITIGTVTDNGTTSSSCRSAFMIKTEVLQSNYNYYANNNTFSDEAVPFVIRWYIPGPEHRLLGMLTTIAIIIGIGLAMLLLSCGCSYSCWLFKTRKTRREARLRTKYFKKRLEQNSSNKDVVEKTKLFSLKEIKKSTDNFNEDRILGHGGQGTVYKGMLEDGQIIAVKKSKTFDENQWEEFINELILLSQVNHKNIVRIVGCCLETNVPILVYEFISNGTLSQHIHNNSTSDSCLINWEMRLRIATEASCAIAYLHSSSTTPIYHRDIKSTNILLDDMYQAKVSDFGISKAVSTDQTHLTTHVKGTFGYLDPEYFWSSQYTEKSDVYSFGVMLIELMTGQQAIRKVAIQDEERSLVEYFISSMNKNSLDEILDPIVLAESRKEVTMAVSSLIKWCLHSRGELRPTMKEVAMELDMIIKIETNSRDTMYSQIQKTEFGLRSPKLEIENVYMSSTTNGFTKDLDEICDEEKCLFHTL